MSNGRNKAFAQHFTNIKIGFYRVIRPYHLRLKSKTKILFSIILLSSGLVLLSGCEPETVTNNSVDQEDIPQTTAKIENNIVDSYARMAAQKSDVCPKLVEQKVGDVDIRRNADVLVNNECEYFLYPRAKDILNVKVNNAQIETLLVVPTLHNFANGSYQVDSYDKHVIRLSYIGATYKPERLSYDVVVSISQ